MKDSIPVFLNGNINVSHLLKSREARPSYSLKITQSVMAKLMAREKIFALFPIQLVLVLTFEDRSEF